MCLFVSFTLFKFVYKGFIGLQSKCTFIICRLGSSQRKIKIDHGSCQRREEDGIDVGCRSHFRKKRFVNYKCGSECLEVGPIKWHLS